MSDVVSVVMPVHNGEQRLGRAIESVLSQTYGDLELLIVDDGSTDGTQEIARSYTDERVRLTTRVEPSGGPSTPRNEAIRRARGGWIAFLDQDDEWVPAKLERQLSIADDSTALLHGRILVDEPGRARIDSHDHWKVDVPDGLVAPELIRRNFVRMPTVVIRRGWVDRVGGFNARMDGVEDYEYWLRMAMSGGEFRFLDEVAAIYNFHGSNLSRQINHPKLRVKMYRQLGRDFQPFRPELRRQLGRWRRRQVRRYAWGVKNQVIRRGRRALRRSDMRQAERLVR